MLIQDTGESSCVIDIAIDIDYVNSRHMIIYKVGSLLRMKLGKTLGYFAYRRGLMLDGGRWKFSVS